ncbi:MAG TPA: ornithine cyclodeaminase family protein [Bryobacteraceae bacterium]|jgi:ornithine cyclodeaminase/alanine dehydrogenase-like protein (mu-crystallin family)|nr:ornithine cyclodeaminase family protein [Bryobacteraceae bacterium]
MPLLLSEPDVRALLTMPELIAAMDAALTAFSARSVVQPVRTVLEVGAEKSFFALMPAYVPSTPALGAKLVTLYESNTARGLPTHLATIVMLDPETGALAAIVDGRYITEARTAAVSAVSIKKLAREDASVLAILGSGVQARSHFEALSHVRNFREVRAWSPTLRNLQAFAAETGAIAKESAEAAVRGADVIVIAVSSHTPILFSDWIAPGAHVVSVGATRPAQQEMDPALVARSRLFVDSRAAALKESGDVIPFGDAHIVAELGEAACARTSPDEITIFKSLGLAVEDVAAAHLALTRAKEFGRGLTI